MFPTTPLVEFLLQRFPLIFLNTFHQINEYELNLNSLITQNSHNLLHLLIIDLLKKINFKIFINIRKQFKML